MVKIPGYTQHITQRAEIPNTVDPQAIDRAASGWNAIAGVANDGAKVLAEIQNHDDTATLNQTIINSKRDRLDFTEQAKKQYEGTPAGFSAYIEKEMRKRDAEIAAGLPARLQNSFKQSAEQVNLQDYESNLKWEIDRSQKMVGAKYEEALRGVENLAAKNAAVGGEFSDIARHLDATAVGLSTAYSPDVVQAKDYSARERSAKIWLAARADVNPTEVIDRLGASEFESYIDPVDSANIMDSAVKVRAAQAKDSFSRRPLSEQYQISKDSMQANSLALDTIMRSEGSAKVGNDGNSGHSAIYGINAGVFPKEFNEAERITIEQGAESADAYVRNFYQKNFLDVYGIDKLPLDVQPIVADGVINHGTTFRNILLQAAKDGASPDQLIAMRRSEYQRLAKGDPKKHGDSLRGWNTRLNNLPRGATGTEFDYLPDSEKADYRKKLNEFEAIGTMPNPASATHQQLVDEVYVSTGLTSRIQSAEPEAISEAVDITKQYGMIPKSLQTALGGMIAGSDRTARIAAYDTIGAIGRQKPQVLAGVNGIASKTMEEALNYVGMTESGMDSLAALKIIDDARLPANKEMQEHRLKEFREIEKDITPDTITNVFDSLFSAEPSLEGQNATNLMYQYKAVFRSNYLTYGSKDGAEKAAAAAMGFVSPSKVTGVKQLMAFAPEKYYGKTDDEYFDEDVLTDEISSQLYDAIKTHVGAVDYSVDERLKKVVEPRKDALSDTKLYWLTSKKPLRGDRNVLDVAKDAALKNTILVPTVNSAARFAVGKKPVYEIYYKNKNGVYDIVLDEKSMPLRWAPDDKKLAEAKDASRVEYEARKMRDYKLMKAASGRRID